MNIYGAPIGTLFGYLCMAVLDYIFIRTALKQRPNLRKAFLKPMICSLLMGLFAGAIYAAALRIPVLHGKAGMFFAMLLSIFAAIAIYGFAVIKTASITYEDMKLIPCGEKIGRLLHMK